MFKNKIVSSERWELFIIYSSSKIKWKKRVFEKKEFLENSYVISKRPTNYNFNFQLFQNPSFLMNFKKYGLQLL